MEVILLVDFVLFANSNSINLKRKIGVYVYNISQFYHFGI